MSGCHRWSWQLSGYDGREHAFEQAQRPADFAEAACSHSVPAGRITAGHGAPRCLACLLIVGDHLAEHHPRTGSWSSPELPT